MASFDQLPAHIEQLSQQAKAFDAAQKPPFRALFDDRTFKEKHVFLKPCIEEIQGTFANLVHLRQHILPDASKIDYVCQQLVSQMEAVQRLLKTKNNVKLHTVKTEKSLAECYEALNQHQEWARRLQLMLRNKTDQYEQATEADDKSVLQAETVTLQSRLTRCEMALQEIDDDITHRESLSVQL
jgi:primosomal replication protein N''